MHEKVEFLREYGADFKKALSRESGAQGGLFDEEKKPIIGNFVTLSL
jgi:hypothetical protein